MESQYSSAIIKCEKILQLTFSFKSREITSVGRFLLVDCKECGEYYMHYTLQSLSAFFYSSRRIFLLQEETSKLGICNNKGLYLVCWENIFQNHLAWLSALCSNVVNIEYFTVEIQKILDQNFLN